MPGKRLIFKEPRVQEEGNIFVASYGNGIVYKINLSIVFTSPHEGEVLRSGASFPLIWQAPADKVSFSLLHSLDNGRIWKTAAPGDSWHIVFLGSSAFLKDEKIGKAEDQEIR